MIFILIFATLVLGFSIGKFVTEAKCGKMLTCLEQMGLLQIPDDEAIIICGDKDDEKDS